MKLKKLIGPEVSGYSFWCPACQERHVYYTENHSDKQYPNWSFNGNHELPTFSPSLLLRSIRHKTMTDEDFAEYDKLVAEQGERAGLDDPRFRHVCHLFITDGKIIYCGDCTHEYAGKTIDLPDIPEHTQKIKS